MLNIFDFLNYREYLTAWIQAQGARAYGQKGKIAASLGVSSSLFSQILKGDKSLTADQASDLADYLALNELESDFFHLLVERDRTGNPRFREKMDRKIKQLQQQSQKIGKRVPRAKELTEEQKAIYYSSWLYAGVWNLTGVPKFQHAEAIAEHLKIEPQLVLKILRFLLENGLCVEANQRITTGPSSTHIDRESPFVNKHHHNWRLQAMNIMERRRDSDVFFTSPMSLSKAAAEEIKKLIPTFIQTAMKISGPSESETTACLNLDWFEY